MGGGDEGGVVVPADPGAAFVVVEAELALQLLVVELDLPAQPGEAGEPFGLGVGGQVREPVVGRRGPSRRAIRRSATPRGAGWAWPSPSCAPRGRARTRTATVIGFPSGPSRKLIVRVRCLPSLAIRSPIASGLRSGRGRLLGRPGACRLLGDGEHGLGREHRWWPRRPRARTRARRRANAHAAQCCRRRPGRRAPARRGAPSRPPARRAPRRARAWS